MGRADDCIVICPRRVMILAHPAGNDIRADIDSA